MFREHNRALKEWAVVCEAMKHGRQTLLIRKGGISEEDGIFRVDDPEFFLLPTYEHQSAALLRPDRVQELAALQAQAHDAGSIAIDAYAVTDTVRQVDDEDRVRRLADEHIWNDQYVKMRFDFNPYDPLYVILLRVYRLPAAVTLPMRSIYGGCRSWVTLERPLSTARSVPALSDPDFARRRAIVLDTLGV